MKLCHIHCNLHHEVFGKSKAQPKSYSNFSALVLFGVVQLDYWYKGHQ